MNNVQQSTNSPPSNFSIYLSDCRRQNRCYDLTKIALLTIVAAGIVLAVVSHFGYLDRAFMYVGAAISPTALIALAVLKLCQPNQLCAAIARTTTFQELKQVLDAVKAKKISCFSCFYWYAGGDGSVELYSDELRGSLSSSTLSYWIKQLAQSDPINSNEKQAVLAYQTKIDDWDCSSKFLVIKS